MSRHRPRLRRRPGQLVEERGASWNLRKTRDRDVVLRRVDEVEQLLDDYGLDWLVVQEAAAYVGPLARRLAGDYVVHTGQPRRTRRLARRPDPLARSRADSAVITRVGLPTAYKRVRRLSGRGWERSPENRGLGLHDPRHLVDLRVGGRRGYRLGSIHLPPTPHAPRLPLRRAAHRADVQVVRRLIRRWTRRGRAWLLAGDWNAQPDSNFVADVTALGSTAGTGIDWALARGVQIVATSRINHGTSDHRPRLFTVRSTR